MHRLIGLVLAMAATSAAGNQAPQWTEMVSTCGVDGSARITNRYTKPLTGLLAQFSLYEGPAQRRLIIQVYLDKYVNHDAAVPPGETRTLSVLPSLSATTPRRCEVDEVSTVFGDGMTDGAQTGIRVLLARRQSLRGAILRHETVVKDMTKVGLAATLTRLNQLKLVADESVRMGQADAKSTVIPVGLVNHWVNTTLPAASQCDSTCAASRMEYILGGLAVWKSEIEIGISEARYSPAQ